MDALQIRYLSPFSISKEIGKEYNKVIFETPNDCWIVLRDWDTLPCTPDSKYGQQISDIIKANPDYSLIGCITNRLKHKHQLYNGVFCDNSDIGEHLRRGKELFENHYSEVAPVKEVAGLCMIFHKSVWEKVKFRENSIFFDRFFCTDLRRKRLKIGIARGLYMFHLYRFGKVNPKAYTKHLLK
jgi:hypothetical protein